MRRPDPRQSGAGAAV